MSLPLHGLKRLILCLLILCLSQLCLSQIASINERVSNLLSKMSLSEKAYQIIDGYPTLSTASRIIYGVVDYPTIVNNLCSLNNFTCYIETRNKFQSIQINASLNINRIATLFKIDAIHSSGPGSTIFPMPITLGSTFNLTLINLIGQTMAFETRQFGAELQFAPELQVLTDPRFCRYAESFADNPLLVSLYGFVITKGLTGGIINNNITEWNKNISYISRKSAVINQGKVYFGYGAGGKDGVSFDTSIQRIYEIYLKGWNSFIAAGGKQIMAAHNAINGIPMHANKHYLTNILRNKYQFINGVIASDCADISKLPPIGGQTPWSLRTGFHFATDLNDATRKSMESGMDQSLCDDIRNNIIYLIENNDMNISVLDRAVRNILTSKFISGVMDNPYVSISDINGSIHNKTSIALAFQAALQGTVMLRNNFSLLPWDINTIKSVAIIGPTAVDESAYYGSYMFLGAPIITIIDSFKQNYPNITINYVKGCDAVDLDINETELSVAIDAVKQSDYVIIMVGDIKSSCGENGDRIDLDLSGGQLELIYQTINIKPNKTVVILLNERPSTFGSGLFCKYGSYAKGNNLINNITQLLTSYHPGEQGGNALTDIIFGKFNPSARLSSSWPQSAAHVHSNMHSPFLKPYQGHENFNYIYNTINPLFPFGAGLSYSQFIHQKHYLSLYVVKQNCLWKISVNVTNNGRYDGYHVVIIFWTKWISNTLRYELNLGGFEKVWIEKKSFKIVDVYLTADSLAYYDTNTNQWILEQGLYYIYDGKDSFEYNYWGTLQLNINKTVYNPCKFWEVLDL